MKKVMEVEVVQPDACINIEVYGSTVGWVFLFDLDEAIQAGTAVIDNPEHRGLLIALLEAAVKLYSEANWQELLPDDTFSVSPRPKEKTPPSEDSASSNSSLANGNDIPF